MKTLNDYMAMSYRMEIVEDKEVAASLPRLCPALPTFLPIIFIPTIKPSPSHLPALMVNLDGTDNEVGQLMVNCKDFMEKQHPVGIDQNQLLNVTVGASPGLRALRYTPQHVSRTTHGM